MLFERDEAEAKSLLLPKRRHVLKHQQSQNAGEMSIALLMSYMWSSRKIWRDHEMQA